MPDRFITYKHGIQTLNGSSTTPADCTGDAGAAINANFIQIANLFDTSGGTGPRGPTGAAGSNGSNGATGPAGSNGSNGSNGATGPRGPTGPAGAAGPVGPTGAAGSNGSNGSNGVTGPAGSPGSTWFSAAASGSPASFEAPGAAGNQFLDTSNGNVYMSNGGGSWVLTGNIEGPQGSNGSNGATGPAGPGANQSLNTTDSPTFANLTISSTLSTGFNLSVGNNLQVAGDTSIVGNLNLGGVPIATALAGNFDAAGAAAAISYTTLGLTPTFTDIDNGSNWITGTSAAISLIGVLQSLNDRITALGG